MLLLLLSSGLWGIVPFGPPGNVPFGAVPFGPPGGVFEPELLDEEIEDSL